ASGEAALEADAAADCLVLDIHLPGMSGLELYRRLALAGKEVPATLSGKLHDEDYKRFVPLIDAAHVGRADVTIIVPAHAGVFFDGKHSKGKETERLYVTPPLVAGKTYVYEIRARWQDGGKPVERTRKVEVTGGARIRVNLLAPAGVQQGGSKEP